MIANVVLPPHDFQSVRVVQTTLTAAPATAGPHPRPTPPTPAPEASRCLTFTSHNLAGSGGKAEVHATAVTDPTTHRLYFHPLDCQFGFWSQANLP